MKFNLECFPTVNTAAGILAGMNYSYKSIVVDHLTINQIDPDDWNRVFLLASEPTFKIRPTMKTIGNKLVVIATSIEPGLEKWENFFFPHWLFCVLACNQITPCFNNRPLLFEALLGRQKDSRTKLVQALESANLLNRGIVSYSLGTHYKPNPTLESTQFDIWDYEEDEIKNLYQSKENYILRDSTNRLMNGYFSSCLIPKRVYDMTNISLVAETDTDRSHVFVTEKTWKPILQGRPTLFYATREHEEFLETIGIKIPYKCYGQITNVVEGLLNPTNIKYVEPNKQSINPNYWINKLYTWLDQFR